MTKTDKKHKHKESMNDVVDEDIEVVEKISFKNK
jgi:hypothetical protein